MQVKVREVVGTKSVRAKAFAYWAKRYRQEVLDVSCEAFGNYLASFIQYLLKEYGDLLTEKDREKCKERLKGRLTEMVRGFEQEDRYSERSMNEAWRKLFMVFCITGDVESKFDVFSYLNTGDTKILPNSTWTRKEIPFGRPRISPQGVWESSLSVRVETLERRLAALLAEDHGKRMTETPIQSFSSLLAKYVKEEMSDRAVTRDSVLAALIGRMNEEGWHFMRPELEFILECANEMFYLARVKAIVKRISQLKILFKEDGTPYELSELLAMPLGFDVIREDQQGLPRSK